MTIECGFWNYLSNNLQTSKSDLLKNFNWKERPFDRVADLLVDLELIQISNDNLELTHISRKWLVENSKDYIGDFIVRANQLSKAYDNISDMMCQDEPNSEMHQTTLKCFGGDSTSTATFTKSMDAMTREFMLEIKSQINFDGINNVFDIGAGLGTISCFLSNEFPEKEFTVLDLNGVVELAQQYINENANPNRIKVIYGDLRDERDWKRNEENTKKSSFDLIILSQILHELTKEETKSLIKKCSDLLVDDGKLVIIGFLDNSDKYKMLSHIFSLNMLFEMGSDNPNISEITELAKQNNITFDKDCHLSAGRMLWLGHKTV
jgi:cyclopropane fatty-acyl-phospholipid synthase-like methyltransferase